MPLVGELLLRKVLQFHPTPDIKIPQKDTASAELWAIFPKLCGNCVPHKVHDILCSLCVNRAGLFLFLYEMEGLCVV